MSMPSTPRPTPATEGSSGGPINLGPPMPTADICSGNVSPNFGVTCTPAIDLPSNTIYMVSKNKSAAGIYSASLHALDLSSGSEKFNGPVMIGSVPSTGDGAVGGVVAFNPWRHFQRASLLLHGGSVYAAFRSHCDLPRFHGWLFGYAQSNKRVILLFGLHRLAKLAGTVALLLEHPTGNVRSGGTRHIVTMSAHAPTQQRTRVCQPRGRFSEFELWVLKTPCTCKYNGLTMGYPTLAETTSADLENLRRLSPSQLRFW